MELPVGPVDVAIIGGGPAGISAALWCSELGLDAVLIEREKFLGGQLRQIYNPIKNYLGLEAANGVEILSHFETSIRPRNFVRRIGIKVTSIDLTTRAIHLGSSGEKISPRAIVIATGVRRRLLEVPGESDFYGKGVLESGAKEKGDVRGRRVLIVGGGDAAFENAVMLSDFAASISIAFRRSEPSARNEFVDAVNSRKNIDLLPGTVVTAILGGSWVEQVNLRSAAGESRTERFDSVLIRIGVIPNSDLIREAVTVDSQGYLKVGPSGETSLPGVYAAGDVANRLAPTISTAAGSAAGAVKAIFHSIQDPNGLYYVPNI